MKSRYLTITLAFAFFMTTLYVVGYLSPGILTWGFHFLGYLPPSFILFLFFIFIGVIILALRYDVQRLFTRGQSFMNNRPYAFLSLLIILFAIAATIFRVKVPLLGDSFYIIKHYADVSRGDSPLDPRNEPLASFIFYFFLGIGGKQNYNQLLNAFYFGEIFLGAIFIITAYLIVKNLFSADQPRLQALLFLLSLPYMQLFWGYIENYSFVLVMLSLYLASAILFIQDKTPFFVVVCIFILNLFSHYLTVLLVPSFLYILYECIKRKKYADVMIGGVIIIAAVVALSFGVQWDYKKLLPFSLHSHFLPVLPPKDINEIFSSAYTLFSSHHLIDLLNYAALMAPAMIALIILQLFQKKECLAGVRHREQKFLLAGFLPIMTFMVMVKFDLSLARDWDVFAPSFLIFAILTLSMFFEHALPARDKIITIILSLSFLHSIGMYTLNSTTEASILRFKNLFDKRTASQFAHYSGSLHLAYYYHQIKDINGGIDVWKEYIKAYPSDGKGYANLLTNLNNLTKPPIDIIISTYEQWIRAIPDNDSIKNDYIHFLTETGNSFFNQGYLREAENFYSKVLRLDPLRPAPYNNMGSAYAEMGKIPEAIAFFQRAIELNPNYADAYYNLGNALSDNHEYEKAKECFIIAAQLGNNRAQIIIEENMVPGPVGNASSQPDNPGQDD